MNGDGGIPGKTERIGSPEQAPEVPARRDPPRVTVIVPTFNSASYLPAAIDSILGQSFTDFEILVVDDGSTDSTPEALAPYRQTIRYTRHENCGIGETRNRALALARGELVAFLDADDLWERDHLEIKVRALDRYATLGGVFSDFLVIDATGAVVNTDGTMAAFSVFKRNGFSIESAFQRRGELEAAGRVVPLLMGTIFETMFLGNFVLPTSLVIRRELALANGPFTAMRTQEDYEYLLRFARHHAFGFVPEPLVRYRRHPEQLTSYARLESILVAASSIVDRYEEDFSEAGRRTVFDRRKAGLCMALGSLYLRQGRIAQARTLMTQGIRRSPGSASSYAHYALSFVPHAVLARLLRW